MLIRLVTIFVTFLINSVSGGKCTNNGSTDNKIQIHNCDSVSYQNLARHFEMQKISKFSAGERNNEFPTISDKMHQSMINLIELWLDDCQIEEIDENAFANLKYLSSLSLQRNKLRALHVNTFSNLGNLRKLFLKENQFEELPAKLFEKNINLRKLYMPQNEIKKLPAGLFETLSELEELSIRNNHLEVLHGTTFEKNKNLIKLYLHYNQIEAVEEGTFDGLTKLTVLNLKLNRYINAIYGSNEAKNIIDLTKVFTDLRESNDKYNTYFKSSSKTSPSDSQTPLITILIIYASIVTILLIIAIIVIVKSNGKNNTQSHSQKTFEMEERVSYHYYSRPDEITGHGQQ
jgi:hypothetical protein